MYAIVWATLRYTVPLDVGPFDFIVLYRESGGGGESILRCQAASGVGGGGDRRDGAASGCYRSIHPWIGSSVGLFHDKPRRSKPFTIDRL